jgi:UDPglucose 6-dehydrogenase
LCRELTAAGARVRAMDPVVKQLPADLSAVALVPDPIKAMAEVDAVVVCTEWPEFRQLPWADLTKVLRGRLVLDANGFLRNELNNLTGIDHVSVGW